MLVQSPFVSYFLTFHQDRTAKLCIAKGSASNRYRISCGNRFQNDSALGTKKLRATIPFPARFTMVTTTSAPAQAQTFHQRTKSRELRVGVIGLGYVGLPLTLLFSEQKFRVTGFDVDRQKIATLNAGGSYIYRIFPEEIVAARSSGFTATTDYAQLSELDAIIICVPTPLSEHHEPDLSYIENTARAIA